MAGVEYSSRDGHFLLFLPEDKAIDPPAHLGIAEIAAMVSQEGGLCVWAHPFRWHKMVPAWLDRVEIHGMEVASSNMDSAARSVARRIAQEKGILTFENSDAHHWRVLGRYGNEIPGGLRDVDDLIRYAKSPRRT